MSTEDKLVEFLRACIAEDEQSALAVGDEDDWREYVADAGMYHRPASGFAASVGTPARILAECDAKRRILELHRGQVEQVEWFDAPESGEAAVCPSCHNAEPTEWHPPVGQAGVRPDGFVASYVLAPCPTLRALALPYAHHPDYRAEEWRP